MTNKLYETMRCAGRRMIAPLVISAGIMLGASGAYAEKSSLPFSPEQRVAITQTIQGAEEARYQNMEAVIDSAMTTFATGLEQAVKDSKPYSEPEQRKVYDKLKPIQEDLEYFIKHPQHEGDTSKLGNVREIYGLLHKNLEGFDSYEPELQKALEKEGIQVPIDPHTSQKEGVIIGLIVLAVGWSLIIGIPYCVSKSK